ncbi:MAG: LysR family transcriptional regulator [Pseudomonadota bacterium]
MDRWDELRTALYVHELGTVSAAAEALGVHRATVIRHIDTLEEQFGTPMFRRHAQGYTATDVCSEALVAVKQAEKLLSLANGKVRGAKPVLDKRTVAISVVPSAMSLVAPGISEFLAEHPEVRVNLENSERILRLDSGEADLVVRAGARPQEPGVVIEHLLRCSIGLYATEEYLRKQGASEPLANLNDHTFIGPDAGKLMPFAAWARRNLPRDGFRVLVGSGDVAQEATLAGMGIGLLPDFIGRRFPQLRLLKTLPEAMDESLWLATHVDSNHPELVAKLIRFMQQCAVRYTASLEGGAP